MFEILENNVRSKETPFNFLPLTYKRGRKLDLSFGHRFLPLFCQKKRRGAQRVFFVIDIQGENRALVKNGKVGIPHPMPLPTPLPLLSCTHAPTMF